MNDNTRCQIITDKMIDGLNLTPDELHHLSSCDQCRGFRSRAALLRERKTLLAPPPLNLVNRIQERIGQLPVPTPVSPARESPWPEIASWFFKPAWAALVLLTFLVSLAWFQMREGPTPTVSAEGFELLLPGKSRVTQAFGRPCQLPDGNGIAVLPDGSRLTFTASFQPLIASRSCRLTNGAVLAEITPRGTGFRVETPHGYMMVTGTLFRVTVHPDRTEVQVSRGSVRIHPLGSAGKLLVAGDSADMLPCWAKPASASEAGFISPSADTDVDVPIR